MDKKMLGTLCAFVGMLAAVWVLMLIMKPFWMPLGWAMVIGILTWPIYAFVHRKINKHDTYAACVMMGITIFVLIIPLSIGGYFTAKEVSSVYQYATTHQLQTFMDTPTVVKIRTQVEPYTGPITTYKVQELVTEVSSHVDDITRSGAGILAVAAKDAVEAGFKIVFFLFFLFFIYKDGIKVRDFLWRNLPVEDHHRDLISNTTKNVLSAYVFGIILTAVAQCVVAGIGLFMTGVPSVFLLAVLTGVAGLIPIVGTSLIWGPCAIWLFMNGHTVAALGLALWCFGTIVVVIDHIAKPAIMSRLVNLPVLIIFVGALGGIVAMGMLGAIMGPLVLALGYNFALKYGETEPCVGNVP